MGIADVIRRRGFFSGMLCGVLLAVLAAYAVNETEFADHFITPLLVDDSSAGADAIVVLGGGIVGACVPNINTLRRAIIGARLFNAKRAPLFVATGGGAAVDSCPVADAIMGFAAEMGVPENRMIVERQSRSTQQNAEFSAPLLRMEGVSRILLVTDRLHMRRARSAFEHQGFAVEPVSVPIYEGHPDNLSMLAAGTREAVALAYYRLRGWTTPMPNGQVRAGATPSAVERPAVAHPDGPLVILGASYAGSWPITSVGGVAVVNNGVAGQQTFQFVERFDRDVIERRPRAVLLWGFINNLFAADDLDAATTAIRADYTQMIARAKAAGIEPILATEITLRRHDGWIDSARALVGGMLGKVSYQERINQYVMETNEWLAGVGAREGLRVLDFQRALADERGRRKLLYAADDGSHVTAAGYEALSLYVRPILARHFALPSGATLQ